VNAAIYSPSGSNAGIGFAIPVDAVSRVVPKLIRNGRVPTLAGRSRRLASVIAATGVIGDVVVTANGKPVPRSATTARDCRCPCRCRCARKSCPPRKLTGRQGEAGALSHAEAAI
jgi:hypothetical protein